MAHILIISGQADLLDDLAGALRREGVVVECVRDGVLGLHAALTGSYELIVVNTLLPSLDGHQVCRRIREAGVQTPVLMFGAQSTEADRMLGFEMGADQFADAHCGIGELRSRVRALLRRAVWDCPCPPYVRLGDVLVDFRKHAVARSGHSIPITPIEFEILRTLATHRGEALRRDLILQEVWGENTDVFPRTIDTHIAHLRVKVEKDPANPDYVVSVRGVGYRLDV